MKKIFFFCISALLITAFAVSGCTNIASEKIKDQTIDFTADTDTFTIHVTENEVEIKDNSGVLPSPVTLTFVSKTLSCDGLSFEYKDSDGNSLFELGTLIKDLYTGNTEYEPCKNGVYTGVYLGSEFKLITNVHTGRPVLLEWGGYTAVFSVK